MTIVKELIAKMQEARNIVIEGAKNESTDGWVFNSQEMFRVFGDLKIALIHQAKANGMTAEEIARWADMDVMEVHVAMALPLVLPVGVGAVVRPKNERDPLHCGSGQYLEAIVISMEPFIMVSEGTDMRWSTWTPDRVYAVRMASSTTLEKCMSRLKD